MNRVFITGDRHGNFDDIFLFCKKFKTTKNDILIILGDAGINYNVDNNPDYIISMDGTIPNVPHYFNTTSSKELKRKLANLPITLFCIHGNHEARPESVLGYQAKLWSGGVVYFETEFNNILFAKDGEIFSILNKKFLVIGGAYSIDKSYRIAKYNMGWKQYKWFSDEQITEKVKAEILYMIEDIVRVDVVLTHTCPKKYEPTEAFLQGLNQDDVDKSTEEFLNIIEEKLLYDSWYCGHYHTEKKVDKIEFLFESIIML